MKPREIRESREQDLFRSRLDQIIDMDHQLVRLAKHVNWSRLEQVCGAAYADGPMSNRGMPPLPTRLMAGLAILQFTFDLSDEMVCETLGRKPVLPIFLRRDLLPAHAALRPLVDDQMTRWRQRMGEEKLASLLQESLAVAIETKAMSPADVREVIVDTTVQPKAVMFPTDAKLMNRAREMLVRLAKKHGLQLRQSYKRVGKLALIKHQRYAHAKQFKRAGKMKRRLKTYLGRTIRDIERQIANNETLKNLLKPLLWRCTRVMTQKPRNDKGDKGKKGDEGKKVYSIHAPEVECIGKGKAHMPYEFGVKVSVATTLHRSKGGQFALHAMALPGNPYDGHTLKDVIPGMEKLIGNEIKRILTDAGYRGHHAPDTHKLRVFVAGQKRGVTDTVKKMMKRRAAIEPVIGHIKNEHRMDRCHLAHSTGDKINAILAAAGYNFRLILNWLKMFLCLIISIMRGSRFSVQT